MSPFYTEMPERTGDIVRSEGQDYLVASPRHKQPHMADTPLCGYGVRLSDLKLLPLYPKGVYELQEPRPDLLKHHTMVFNKLLTTSGTDPEVFVSSQAGGGIIPAWKFLPNEQTAPIFNTQRGRFRAYWDGFQAEMSHPADLVRYCHELIMEDMRQALFHIQGQAQKVHWDAKLLMQDVVEVSKTDLEEAANVHVQLGCAPSRNAYPDIHPIDGIDGRTLPIRFSGTHIHSAVWGMRTIPSWFPDGTIIMIDKIAGLLLTALGRGMENPVRRQFYGRPGEYRLPKSTGDCVRLEYRTPGSFLMRHPAIFMHGLDLVRGAMRLGMLVDGREIDIPDVRAIIMNCDADAACEVINHHRKFFTRFLNTIYSHMVMNSYNVSQAVEMMFNTYKHGFQSILQDRPPEVAWDFNHAHQQRYDDGYLGLKPEGWFHTHERLVDKNI